MKVSLLLMIGATAALLIGPARASDGSESFKGSRSGARIHAWDPKAQFLIGCACEYGVARTAPDRAQAIDWCRKAAEKLVPAQYLLGETYLSTFDFVNGYVWLKIANLNGYKDPDDRLSAASLLLNNEQLKDAEERVSTWKRQHGMN